MKKNKAEACIYIMGALMLIAACVCPPAAGDDSVDRGESFYDKSRFDQAIVEFTRAVTHDPHDARVYFLRANAYYNKRDFARAIADLDAGLSLMPQEAQAYYNRAVVYYTIQEYDRAWEDAYRAASLGYVLDPLFLEQLKEDSGRER